MGIATAGPGLEMLYFQSRILSLTLALVFPALKLLQVITGVFYTQASIV